MPRFTSRVASLKRTQQSVPRSSTPQDGGALKSFACPSACQMARTRGDPCPNTQGRQNWPIRRSFLSQKRREGKPTPRNLGGVVHSPVDLVRGAKGIKVAPYGSKGEKYFAIGENPRRPPMKSQEKLLRSIVGEEIDAKVTQDRRRLGWKVWATGVDCAAATAFEAIELPAISFSFEGWLEDDGHLETVAEDVRRCFAR
jgi:hypothetical protein